MAGFFPAYFKAYWSQGLEVTESTAVLGAANSLAGLIVALSAPILGAVADSGGFRKKFLTLFAYLGVLSTFALFMVQQGHWLMAAVIYAAGAIGFSGSIVFYDSLLPSLADEKRIDYLSSLGYGLGYLGGGLLFAVNVLMTLKPEFFGLSSTQQAVQISFVMVALWWGGFAIPIILFVKEPPERRASKSANAWKAGVAQLLHTFKKVRSLRTVFIFLLAYWFYIDGVDTIVRMAVDYGMSIGFEMTDLLAALLITQFVAFPFAILAGRLAQVIGPKRTIYIAIGVYLFVVVWASMMTERYEFYALAIVIAFVQGGIQALSRSFYSRIIPPDQTAEFFGFYNLLGKFAVILGPVLIGLTGLISRNPRFGILSIAILFLLGGVLLFFVDEERGARELQEFIDAP